MQYRHKLFIFFCFLFFSIAGTAQQPIDTTGYKVVIAASSFQEKSKRYQKRWGRNRRVEWATPVRVPLFWLDTAYGGLKPYQTGGGNETKSLRLRSVNGKEYAIRSIYKSRADVILPIYRGSFIEDIIKDGISSSYPYGAFPVSIMQEQAGIYHTLPVLIYLPPQNALDTFNARFGNDLYLVEQRPDGDWSDADNLGNFKEYSATSDVITDLLEHNRSKADQYAFIKARLFDMLICDWDRHEDNWRWGIKKSGDDVLYVPIPRDRDQAFYTHNGWLVDFLLPAAGLAFMQNFDYKVGNMATLNTEERNMDRFFTNELTLDDWLKAARSLQQSLTDTVIAQSVRQLPPEIFLVSGDELIQKLISRRNQLIDFTTRYYQFITTEVEITGTKQREYFEVTRNDSTTLVTISRINSNGLKEEKPYYTRTFKPVETKEIRIYGIAGEDGYSINGNASSPVVRIIGGPDKDSLIQSGSRVYIYDDRNNVFHTHSVKLHLSADSAIHAYKYESYNYSSKGFSPRVFHNRKDRIFIGINYDIKKHKWRRDPYAVQHTIGINYSVSQQSVSAFYSSVFPNLIHKWDLTFDLNYDAARWVNFYGLGNKTTANPKDIEFYRARSNEWFAGMGLRRVINKSTVTTSVFYQRVNIKTDTSRYPSKLFSSSNPGVFAPNNYAGLLVTYTYASVDDRIVPTKGVTFLASGMYANNFRQKEFFHDYSIKCQTYLPLSKKFSIAIKAGGETIVGGPSVINNAQAIEHAMIGGPETLRGYPMERFWGKTSFYNTNELRFITNLRTYILNAKLGFIGFFDDGRVWIPGENSDVLHTSYGAGLLLAPFNSLCFTLTYGITHERNMIQFRFNSLF